MKALLQTAQNLLAKGMSVADVSEATGIGAEQLMKLKK